MKRIYIAVPSYDGKVAVDHEDSLLNSAGLLWKEGFDIYKRNWVGGLHEEARLKLVEDFLKTDAEALVWTDADGGWNSDGFMKIALSPKDFVAGLFLRKNSAAGDYPVAVNTTDGRIPLGDRSDGTLSIALVGLALAKISRAAIEKMVEHYGLDVLFERIRIPGQSSKLGEDYSFCKRWTDIGGEIWLVPDINTVHVGAMRWAGNYHKFLLDQPKEEPKPVEPAQFDSFGETLHHEWIPPVLRDDRIGQALREFGETGKISEVKL